MDGLDLDFTDASYWWSSPRRCVVVIVGDGEKNVRRGERVQFSTVGTVPNLLFLRAVLPSPRSAAASPPFCHA